eukprot:scaffold4661_cov108-Cylindrotheca_fusiformis.AAC.2
MSSSGPISRRETILIRANARDKLSEGQKEKLLHHCKDHFSTSKFRVLRTMLRLAVFDLDHTVWQPEMYQCYGEPRLTHPSSRVSDEIKQEARTTEEPMILVDSHGKPMRVFPGA